MGGVKDLFGIPKWLDKNEGAIDLYLGRLTGALKPLLEIVEGIGKEIDKEEKYSGFIDAVRLYVREAEEFNDLDGPKKFERVQGLLSDGFDALPDSLRNAAVEIVVQIEKFTKEQRKR